MTKLALKTKKSKSTQVLKYNKKQAITQYMRKFKFPFEMKDDGIDLREMAKNFPNEIIPLQDVHGAISIILGPQPHYQNINSKQNNIGDGFLGYTTRPIISFDFVDWNSLYLWPIFQRDVAPNHIEKIFKDFDETSIVVPCVVRITLKEQKKTIYCVWDGHHTIQVCRLKGWDKFPAWVIDVDQIPLNEVEQAGFDASDEGRIQYGCFKAGKNMRRINGLNKRPLSPYDDFMIGYETRDADIVSMMNILTKNGCVVKRHATAVGAFTQIKSGMECYNLEDSNGNKGIFWDRALKFHRKVWPLASLTLEVFRPLSYLYHQAALQGFNLNSEFDKELENLLVGKYGDSESVQELIKESYWDAYNTPGGLVGEIPEHDKFRVLYGIINLYRQNNGKFMLPNPKCQWIV